MAATRLRKTFHYPADDSEDDDTPRDLDEEEQEKLIAKLKAEDDERNKEYKRIFLAIPAIAATSYLPALIMSPLLQARLVSILSVTSLLATAYILFFVPSTRQESAHSRRPRPQQSRELGPIQRYISYLNGGLSVLISLNAFSFRDKRGVHEGFWLLCLLPIMTFSIIMLARRLMLSVDVGELEDLKYRYKGA